MATGESGTLARNLEQLWNAGTLATLTDAELVQRFTTSGGPAAEGAFETLLGRHGPMVLGVCRHILRRPQDVDDAFQATFLVLVRKARSIRVDESLAPWLYGVAYRTAIRARVQAARHHPEEMDDLEAAAADPASGAFAWEIRPMLHEELNRLPEKYRSPIVLCHLEGKSHEEAARMLDWPVGTLSGRLSRGRQLLKDRLQRRGLTASAGMLAARFPGEALQAPPPRLVELTIKLATGSGAGSTVSTSVLRLAQGVLSTMFLHSFQKAALVLMSLAIVTGAFGIRAGWGRPLHGDDESPTAQPQAEAKPVATPGTSANPPSPVGAVSPAQAVPKALPKAGPNGSFVLPKNSPNMADSQDPIPVIRMASMIIVQSPDGRTFAAMSAEHGEGDWKRYEVPAGQVVSWAMTSDLLTFFMIGDTISEIAAYSAITDNWAVQRLIKPIKERISPVLATDCALFQEGHNFYAFSAQTGTWGVLSLPDGEKPRAECSPGQILVQQGDKVYVFLVKQAKWSTGTSARPSKKLGIPSAAPKSLLR